MLKQLEPWRSLCYEKGTNILPTDHRQVTNSWLTNLWLLANCQPKLLCWNWENCQLTVIDVYREYFKESAGVRYLHTSCFCIRNRTSEISDTKTTKATKQPTLIITAFSFRVYYCNKQCIMSHRLLEGGVY